MKSILSFALISLAILAPLSGEAAEFIDPPIIHAGPSGIKIRAHNATEILPGLGPVSGLYVYDITTGANGAGEQAARHAGVPAVIEAARGGALKIEFQNDLKSHDALGAEHPAESNLHSHGLIVSPQGLGFGGRNPSMAIAFFCSHRRKAEWRTGDRAVLPAFLPATPVHRRRLGLLQAEDDKALSIFPV